MSSMATTIAQKYSLENWQSKILRILRQSWEDFG